jgi:hypothetical protein
MAGNRKTALLASLVLLLLAGGAAVYAAPYLVVWRLRDAVERGDSEAVAPHVDFPALRSSVKAAVSAAVTKNTQGSSIASQLLGSALAGNLANQMVDAMVTPETVGMFLRGEKPALKLFPLATASETITTQGYEDASTFVVNVRKVDDPLGVGLVFTRDGLSWKLSAARLPF